MDNETEDDRMIIENNNSSRVLFMVISILWPVFGLLAFAMSVTCKNGTFSQKILGVLLSMFLGPLYFIYFFVASKSGYCTDAMKSS
jgi:RsiW-degrading membrane proteinase PrsW (M82 family)